MNKGYVYILCNKKNGTLYVGVTSDLIKRVYQHKEKEVKGFTKKYGYHFAFKLVLILRSYQILFSYIKYGKLRGIILNNIILIAKKYE